MSTSLRLATAAGRPGFAGLGRLLVHTAAVFALLRLAHALVPRLYPQALPGPLAFERLEPLEAYTGFSPLVPYFHPEALGDRPAAITAWRQPAARVVIEWRAARRLRLEQCTGADCVLEPVPAAARPLPGAGDALHWADAAGNHAAVAAGAMQVQLTTDLDPVALARLVRTLAPLARQR